MKKNTNKEQRLKFIDMWAEFVKTHPDKEWSRQQNIVVNQTPAMTKEQFLDMKLAGKAEKGEKEIRDGKFKTLDQLKKKYNISDYEMKGIKRGLKQMKERKGVKHEKFVKKDLKK